MDFLVHGQLAGLTEGTVASIKVTLEGFLLGVDVCVLFQILGQCESFEAQHTDVLLDRRVGRDVSPQREAGGVGLVAARDFAFVWSFHYFNL